MTRTAMNEEEREAMRILDLVAAGIYVHDEIVWRALCITGDAIGLKRG
jgi:hypothetical protein